MDAVVDPSTALLHPKGSPFRLQFKVLFFQRYVLHCVPRLFMLAKISNRMLRTVDGLTSDRSLPFGSILATSCGRITCRYCRNKQLNWTPIRWLSQILLRQAQTIGEVRLQVITSRSFAGLLRSRTHFQHGLMWNTCLINVVIVLFRVLNLGCWHFRCKDCQLQQKKQAVESSGVEIFTG